MTKAHHSSCDKTFQEFFKVFIPETSSTQLRIPKAFTKFINGTTTSEAILVDHDHNSWDIELAKIEGRYILKNGWQQFAKDKCLEKHDFLIFEYDGNSTFYVKKIFSESGCRKEAENCGKFVPIMILDKDSDQSCRKRRGRKRKHSTPGLKINEKSKLEGPSKGTRSKSTRAYEAIGDDYDQKPSLAPAKCVPLNKPHFAIHFSPWRLRAEIPGGILRKWNIKLMSELSLRDENGKLWPVMVCTTDIGRHYFGQGWSDFRKSNNIQEGYKCDFQFVIDEANVAKELLVHVHPN